MPLCASTSITLASEAVLELDTKLCGPCIDLVQDIVSGDALPEERWHVPSPHRDIKGRRIFAHYSNVSLLKSCGDSGCPLCRFLVEQVAEDKSPTYEIVTGFHVGTFQVLTALDYWRGDFYLYHGYSARELDNKETELKVASRTSDQSWHFRKTADTPGLSRLAREPLISPKDAKSIALASRWLQDCLTKHPKCVRSPNSPLPKRVIDIGNGNSDPYLYTSAGGNGAYISLSYCWGGDVECKLTSTNLEDYQKRIDLAGLPQTFKDAMYITHLLNYRYLWIDALCIVQDDNSDWEH